MVKSFNEGTKSFEWKLVVQLFKKQAPATLHIQLSNGELMKVTPEHRIWVNDGNVAFDSSLLQSAGGLACAANLSNCASVLEHKDALVQEVKDRGLPQPKAGSDIKWYNMGQQAGHAGTVFLGVFESNAGRQIVSTSIGAGVADAIPTAGVSVAVSAGDQRGELPLGRQ